MGDAKSIRVMPIGSTDARAIVRRHHYSGKVVANSQLHLGVFVGGKCEGAMQFGPPLDKRKLIGLVEGTAWNGFIELNRMAFSERLPRNSESRALAYAFRFMRKQYPWIEWVVSFADGCQSGDGSIYRACGFVLTAIKRNNQIWANGDAVDHRVTETKGERIARSSEPSRLSGIKRAPGAFCTASARPGIGAITNGAITNGASSMAKWKEAGYAPLPGFQLRYVYFLNPDAKQRLTVPALPFSEIERRGAGMYRGKPRAGSADSGTAGNQPEGGGATPTPALLQERGAPC